MSKQSKRQRALREKLDRSRAYDIMEALGCWDNEHRAAFVAWAAEPWWA